MSKIQNFLDSIRKFSSERDSLKLTGSYNGKKSIKNHSSSSKSITEVEIESKNRKSFNFKNLRFGKQQNVKPKIPKFRVKVELENGEFQFQIVEAETRAQAKLNVASEGFSVIDVKPIVPWYKTEIGGKIPDAVLLKFSRQMASFTAAGISIAAALSILERTSKNKILKNALQAMVEDIENGDSLGMAVTAQSSKFPTYYSTILSASERIGSVTNAFDTLSDYVERDLKSKRAVRSALYYPTTLVILGITAVFIINIFVLPRFAVFFESLNAELPAPTRALMAISSFISTWWLFILAFLLILVLAIIFALRTEKGAFLIHKALLKLPVFGSLIELIVLERFNRVLGTLETAGVPLPDALSLGARVVGNEVYSRAILETRRGVLNGEGLSAPMEATGVFSEVTVQVVLVGEKTGRLAYQLQQAAKMHGDELDYRLKNFTSLLEPIVLIVVGGAVGFVAIALVSAMYGIYNTGNLVGG